MGVLSIQKQHHLAFPPTGHRVPILHRHPPQHWLLLFSNSSHPNRCEVVSPSGVDLHLPWKENYDQPWQHIKKQRHYFANKGLSSQGYGFSSGHLWMWEMDYEESWVPKNWCLWTVVLEKTLESPLDCKEIQPVHPKGNQSLEVIEYSLEGLMLKLKLQYFGHLMRRTDSFEKTLILGKIEGRSRRGQQRTR